VNYVNLKYYKNTTSSGAKTTSLVQKSIFYYGYGTDETLPNGQVISPTEMRGEWCSSRGPEQHSNVINWAVQNAENHTYTYTMILSLKDGQMEPEDFQKAMDQAGKDHFNDYRLIVHYDTDHDHAHVVGFRDKTMSRADFNQFRLSLRNELGQLENQRIQEKDQRQEQQFSQGISVHQEMDWEDDLGLS
jgi:hypothetical protein